ncbi:YbhB/YbcL family Raf kinase inhibitor-like protein [Aporhodopirellula aestuarii]|uniref:YbhB/YbcL family Raf kinase inhibitor-like protein n=1 Tax=Aporhodopirellula aestuarii TaxID=2950107 RepID=A0ABT0U5B5_9BACT|nr:YbhB/YbcL family Raf kinase inhibitor-like protein [Aporhodopirellula aestuarii]MCM2372110.1 YbhB/YbcL family Raf kinase inhibitor-like protein [Aporhodopirellula aestuarii]
MRILQPAIFLLLILIGFSCKCWAQIPDDQLPSAVLRFGTIGIENQNFTATEFSTVKETVPQQYQEQVPITTVLPNGSTVTETQVVLRTRNVVVDRIVPNPYSVPEEAISFSTVAGQRITDIANVRKLLQAESRPAVIKWDTSPLDDFYAKFLSPKLMIVHIDQSKMSSPPANDPFGGPAGPLFANNSPPTASAGRMQPQAVGPPRTPTIFGSWQENNAATNQPVGITVEIQSDGTILQREPGKQDRMGTVRMLRNLLVLDFDGSVSEQYYVSVTADRIDFHDMSGAPAGFYWTRNQSTSAALNLTSTVINNGAPVNVHLTADGRDVSPPLSWSQAPDGTRSFALICDDPDAPSPNPWVHWVIYNIPADRSQLPAGIARDPQPVAIPGARQGINSWNSDNLGYRGPDPPPGSGPHRYFFKLYALDTMLNLQAGAPKEILLQAMQGHVLAEGQLIGTYER